MEHLTPESLTLCLKRGGTLEQGKVLSAQAEPFHATNAANFLVDLTYSDDAPPDMPPRLFVKRCEQWGEFADAEVRWYTHLAPRCPHLKPVQCYGYESDADAGSYTLLLADLTQTHKHNFDVAPTFERYAPIVEQFAALYAGWWNHSELGTIVGELPGAEVVERAVGMARNGKERMLQNFPLTPAQQGIIEHIFATHPRKLMERGRDNRNLTCVHGDPNPGNLLSPNDGVGASHLIDYQPFVWSMKVWVGVSDLSHMMVHWWETETRRALELPLLRHYHRKLEEFGVTGYPFEECLEDYRLCAVQSLYIASAWCADAHECETMDWVWKPQLQKTLVAIVDLECLAIL